jgi:drug/metabolite transporter (DMT)-like permease
MNTTGKGTIALLLAASYGMYGIYSRLIGGHFGEFTQSWTKNAIIISLLSIFLIIKKSWKQIERNDWKWMILWPLSDVISIVLLYIAFNNLSIGTSYFLLYATMIIGGFIFGSLLYKEQVNKVKALSIILSLVGLSLIFSVEFSPGKFRFMIFGLLAGISTALWNALSKKVSDRYPNTQLVFIDAAVALAATLIGSLIVQDAVPPFTNPVWTWQILYAVTQICAVAFVIIGFRYLEAQVASVILPIEVIFGVIFGFFFFGEILPLKSLLGGLLIVSAAALPYIRTKSNTITNTP